MRDWSVEETFKLISELEINNCLWEKANSLYKNVDKRAAVMEEIAKKFENCTGKDIKEKIRSLRCVFMEQCRKIKKSGSAGGVQVKWKFFHALQFLKGEVAECGEVDSLVAEKEVLEQNEEELQISQMEFLTPLSSNQTRKKIKRGDEISMEMRSERHKMVQELVNTIKETKDSKYMQFGHFVATTIENMKDPDLEELCQLKIRMILSEMSSEACKRQIMSLNRTTSTPHSSNSVYSSDTQDEEQLGNTYTNLD